MHPNRFDTGPEAAVWAIEESASFSRQTDPGDVTVALGKR